MFLLYVVESMGLITQCLTVVLAVYITLWSSVKLPDFCLMPRLLGKLLLCPSAAGQTNVLTEFILFGKTCCVM